MQAPVVPIKPAEFAEIHNKNLSLDEYKTLRVSASHFQALEVLMAGNIRAMTYLRCIHYGATHEDILDFADNSEMKRESFLSSCESVFDSMVRYYVGPGVSLKDAFIAKLLNIPNGSTTYKKIPALREILQHTTIEDLAYTWQQLTPRMNERTFLRYVASGIAPEDAIKLLHH